MHEFYSSPVFEEKFTYSGNDLGAVWSREKTCFRLWAPTAEKAALRLYKSGTADDFIEEIEMTASDCGTWVAEKYGDLNGVYYTFCVRVK